jgi:hypothetical protein
MHVYFRIALLISTASSCAPVVFGQEELPRQTPNNSYTILYTGRLFGYFRYPEVQKKNEDGCPRQSLNPNDGTAAGAFQEVVNGIPTIGTTIRVAAGDNLAPFLLGRSLWDPDDKDDNNLNNKGDYDLAGSALDLESGRGTVGTDNVGCFLRLMQFDAVVPGMHDFYFGPERLRAVASFLRSARQGDYQPVRMLGANLSIRTRYIDPGQPQTPEQDRLAGLGKKTQPQDPSVVLPKVVLPWMRAVKVKNAIKVVRVKDQVQLGENALQDVDFDAAAKRSFRDWLNGSGEKPLEILAADNEKYRFKLAIQDVCMVQAVTLTEPVSTACLGASIHLQPTSGSPTSVDVEYWISSDQLLNPDTTYQLCLVDGGTLRYWRPFAVQAPYFEYPATAAELKANDGLKPWVYKASATAEAQSVTIFGVVDPNLVQYVGRLNYTWLNVKDLNTSNVDDRHETIIQVSDPAESLKQILQYCDRTPACKASRKILLAQMPQQNVYDILGELRALKDVPSDGHFDVIIAQADPDRASGDRTTLKAYNPTSEERHEFDGPVVLVPGSHFLASHPYKIQVRLQVAIVTPSAAPGNGAPSGTTEERLIKNAVHLRAGLVSVTPFIGEVAALKVDCGKKGCRTLIEALRGQQAKGPEFRLIANTDLSNAPALPGLDRGRWKRGLEQIALKVMRDSCHADVALLQHRDVFFDEPLLDSRVNDHGIPLVLDAIFWKGDYIQCTNLTGETINGLLARSKDLQNREDNGLTTDLTSGWSLATLGVADQESNPKHRLIDGQYLDPKRLYSVAITDYLANGDTGYPVLQGAEPPPDVPWSKQHFRTLAVAIGEEILKNRLNPHSIVFARASLDAFIRPLPPPPRQPGFLDWWSKLLDLSQMNKLGSLEQSAQQKTGWSISLYKLDASYSLFAHSGTEASLGHKFPGVTSVDLGAPDSSTLSFDYILRVQRESKHWDDYVESDLNYGHKANRAASGAYQHSQTANYWYHEAGVARRIKPDSQNPTGLKLLLPMALRMQLYPPLTQITPESAATAKPITATSAISYYAALRPGLRFDYVYPKPNSSSAGGGGSGSAGKGPSAGQSWNSYIQFGYQSGRLFNGPNSYTFSNGQTCSVVGITQCITTVPASVTSVIVRNGREHYQSGFYLDFRLDMPVPRYPGAEFIVENRGDFFAFGAKNDTAIDTRLFNDLRSSLTMPIPALRKLSLAPTFEMVVFKNKLAGNLYYSYNTFVSVNYSFDWHQGLSWKRVLGFSNPVPTLPTLPSR